MADQEEKKKIGPSVLNEIEAQDIVKAIKQRSIKIAHEKLAKNEDFDKPFFQQSTLKAVFESSITEALALLLDKVDALEEDKERLANQIANYSKP